MHLENMSELDFVSSSKYGTYFFKAAAMLAWKRTFTSMVAAGPMWISALMTGPAPPAPAGPAPELALALDKACGSWLLEAAALCWEDTLLRC